MSELQAAMTWQQMAEAESEAERMVHVFMRAYLEFPTANNFDLVLARMREFQSAWMDGRER